MMYVLFTLYILCFIPSANLQSQSEPVNRLPQNAQNDEYIFLNCAQHANACLFRAF
jgi:hypothetical protein